MIDFGKLKAGLPCFQIKKVGIFMKRLLRPAVCLALGIFLLLSLCLSGSVAESSGSELIWNLTDAGVLTISGTGEMTEHPWTNQTDKIRQVVVGDGILNICSYAFYDCTNLTDVSLPRTLGRIEESAFSYCTQLTNVTLPESTTLIGEQAFRGSGLTQISLNEGLAEIGICAFLECDNLRELRIPSSVTRISDYAFEDGLTLYAVIGSNGAKALGKAGWGFREQGGHYVYRYRFEENLPEVLVLEKPVNRNIESADNIHTQVSVIGSAAFQDCSRLHSISFPSGLKVIGSSAFSGCKKLENVRFPAGLKEIQSYAFNECSKLSSIEIPEKTEEIGYNVFPDKTIIYAEIGSTGAMALGRNQNSFRPVGNDTVLLRYICESNQIKGLELLKILHPQSTVKIPDGVTTFGTRYFSSPLLEHGGTVTCLELPDSINSLRMCSFAGARRNFYIKCGKNSYAAKFAKSHGLQYQTESAKVIGYDIAGADAKVNWIISNYITSDMSEYQKVRVINDWLTCNAHYDYSYSAHSAEGVLNNGAGVCESYARAAQKLLDKAGIRNMYIGGSANNGSGYAGHAWNLVNVNGSWYHLDTTWNDPADWNDPAVISGYEGYHYFLLTSAQISGDHSWNIDIPETGPELGEETDDGRVDLNGLKFSSVKDQVFTGKAIKPGVVIKDGKIRLKANEDYTLTYKSNKAVGKATIIVTGQGKYKGTRQLTFRIVPAAVQLKSLKAGKGKMTVTWKKGVKVDGYEIEYSLKKNFKSSEKVSVSKGGTTKKTINKLKSGKKYYVRVRAWKKVKGEKFYSAWSNILNKKAK